MGGGSEAAADCVQAALSGSWQVHPFQNEQLESAGAVEAVEGSGCATLSLRMLSTVPIQLTPKHIAMLSQEQVDSLLNTYRVKLGGRLLAAESTADPVSADLEVIQVLQFTYENELEACCGALNVCKITYSNPDPFIYIGTPMALQFCSAMPFQRQSALLMCSLRVSKRQNCCIDRAQVLYCVALLYWMLNRCMKASSLAAQSA